jgi:hypothetical protein
VVTPDSGGVLAEHEAAATRAQMGLAQGHGGLRWVGGELDRVSWAESGVGLQRAKTRATGKEN